jgi:hypothetical protein
MAHWPNTDKEAAPSQGFVNRMETLPDDPDPSPKVPSGPRVRRVPEVRGARSAPTEAQRSYLARGLREPGGKLPLFDVNGREIARKTVESCLARGWAEPWFDNPMKPDWLVCRLTAEGYRAVGAVPPAGAAAKD